MAHNRQLEFPSWGGRRPGAGRKQGPNPRVRHLSRPKLRSHFPCHVTLRVRRGVPSMRHWQLVAELEQSFRALTESRREFRVCHYSIQKDHAHFLVEASNRQALGRGMKALGARLARAVNRIFERSGRVLADRYHLRILETPREVRSALAYVLKNSAKHARKLGLRARYLIDPASSGRWFDGWASRWEPVQGPCPVAPPRTWLLRSGWKRHRRIELPDLV